MKKEQRAKLVGKKIVAIEENGLEGYGDAGLRTVMLHLDDGTAVEFHASTVMFDQYSHDPVLKVAQVIGRPLPEKVS